MAGIANRLLAGQSGVRIPVQAKYLNLLQNVHTGCGTPRQTSYPIGTEDLSREQGGRGVKLTIHHLLPWLGIR